MTAKTTAPMTAKPTPILSVAASASNPIQLRRSPRSEFAMKLRALARDVEAGAITIATIHLIGIDRQIIRHDFGNPFGSSGRAKP